jgi:hypothetical protein
MTSKGNLSKQFCMLTIPIVRRQENCEFEVSKTLSKKKYLQKRQNHQNCVIFFAQARWNFINSTTMGTPPGTKSPLW